jgi:hypothetical protein
VQVLASACLQIVREKFKAMLLSCQYVLAEVRSMTAYQTKACKQGVPVLQSFGHLNLKILHEDLWAEAESHSFGHFDTLEEDHWDW